MLDEFYLDIYLNIFRAFILVMIPLILFGIIFRILVHICEKKDKEWYLWFQIL